MIEPKFWYLLIYAVVMIIITIRSVKKGKSFIYCSLWVLYTVSAITCVVCKAFQTKLIGISIMHSRWYDLSDTTLYGYLLIALCCLIAFKPFDLFVKESDFEQLGQTEGKTKKQIYNLFSVIYVFVALLFIVLSTEKIAQILKVSDYGYLRLSLYGNSENESEFVMTTNVIANFCYKLCLQFKYLNVFISASMIKDRYKTYLAIISLGLAFFVYYLFAVGNAARGGLLIFTFCSAMIVGTFFKYMSDSSRRKVLIIGAIGLGIVISFFIAVTISRFGNDKSLGNPVVRNVLFYLGHGPIEFSKITGSLKRLAWGKTIIGRLGKHYFGLNYSWNSIQSEIGYPSIGSVFVTYLGFIYTDFGSVGCIAFVSAWSWFMCSIIRRNPNRISTVFLFLYYLNYYVTGAFSIGRLEYAALITAHVIFLAIRLIEDVLRRQNRTPGRIYIRRIHRSI